MTRGSALDEFELIRRYFSGIVFPSAAYVQDGKTYRAKDLLALGIGDDAAILHLPDPLELVFSIDTQVAGVHFPADADPAFIAQRAFRCAASDLAAMGATPLCFTLALTLPDANAPWLDAFSQGLKTAARDQACSLVGGDTTQGPLAITIQVHGLAVRGKTLKRSGAQPDDLIVVSGALGSSAAYVRLMQEDRLGDKALAHAVELFEQAYYFPLARVVLGHALAGLAHSAIDVSDGLLADLGHLCERSKVCAELHLDRLPMLPELKHTFGDDTARQLALTGGDDYELCFTLPERRWRHLQTVCEDIEVGVTAIGKVTAHADDTALATAPRITCYDAGQRIDAAVFRQSGYRHF